MKEKRKLLIRNAFKCKKCNTVIESIHRHDFKYCECGSVFIDGGLDYQRGGYPGGNFEDWVEDLSEYKEYKETNE
jgi:hypothetical protein